MHVYEVHYSRNRCVYQQKKNNCPEIFKMEGFVLNCPLEGRKTDFGKNGLRGGAGAEGGPFV